MDSIFEKLTPIVNRYNEIEESMSQPAIAEDFEQIQVIAKERATLEELVAISRQHHSL